MEGIKTTYEERNLMRQKVLENATMGLVAYFLGLGDDMTTAQTKVSQLSTEVAAYIFPYILGNTELINQINASTLAFMDDDAKAAIVNILNGTNG